MVNRVKTTRLDRFVWMYSHARRLDQTMQPDGNSLTLHELRHALKEKGLSPSGLKPVLVERYNEHIGKGKKDDKQEKNGSSLTLPQLRQNASL